MFLILYVKKFSSVDLHVDMIQIRREDYFVGAGGHQSPLYFLTLCASLSLPALDMREKTLLRLNVLCILLNITLVFFPSGIPRSFATLCKWVFVIVLLIVR